MGILELADRNLPSDSAPHEGERFRGDSANALLPRGKDPQRQIAMRYGQRPRSFGQRHVGSMARPPGARDGHQVNLRPTYSEDHAIGTPAGDDVAWSHAAPERYG